MTVVRTDALSRRGTTFCVRVCEVGEGRVDEIARGAAVGSTSGIALLIFTEDIPPRPFEVSITRATRYATARRCSLALPRLL
jgi:hypothetical protein